MGSSGFKGGNVGGRDRNRKCGTCGSAEQMFSPPPSSPPAKTWTMVKLNIRFDG